MTASSLHCSLAVKLFIETAGNAIVKALLAPICVSCRAVLLRPLDGPICNRCWSSIPRISPPWCRQCGDALASGDVPDALCTRCTEMPPQFMLARSAGRYEGALRELIHALKYDGRRMVAAPLARLMRHAGTEILDDADAVVPVPLHPLRLIRRGFNQADDLSRHLGLPIWRVLKRTRLRPSQAGLPAASRQSNTRGAFAYRPSWHGPNRTGRASHRPLEGRTLVLIDDVMTTGATLDACSEILMEAGARSVRALTAARAVARQPQPPPQPPPLWTAARR